MLAFFFSSEIVYYNMLRNILLIDDRIPDPGFGAGFPRAYRLMLNLYQLGHKITFYPNVKESVRSVNHTRLAQYNITVCDDWNKLPTDIDLIIASRPHNVHYHLPIARKINPQAKCIYDTEALWFKRYDIQMAITGKLPFWAYRYDELGMARNVDLCFVVNDVEKKILEEAGCKYVVKLGHALPVHRLGKDFMDRKDILVVGGRLEEDSSNEDGLWEYCSGPWPEVNSMTNAKMLVSGEVTSPRLKQHNFHNVQLAGHVKNLIPLYEQHRIFVAATRFATGIPWKVHEAMAYGIPCVISELLANQLQLAWDVEAMVCRTTEEYVEKSVLLYKDETIWTNMREAGFRLINRDCSPLDFSRILQASIDELCP